MDMLEVDIDDRDDAIQPLEEDATTPAVGNTGLDKDTTGASRNRKRKASLSPGREYDDRRPREDRHRDFPSSKDDYYPGEHPRNKYRRTHMKFDYRNQRGRTPRGNQRGPYIPWNKDHLPFKRWDAQVVTVLDAFDKAKEDILNLTDVLARIGDALKPTFTTFESAVEELPIKTGAYASVVGMFMGKDMVQLVEQITQRILHRFGSLLTSGKRIPAIHCLRFLIGIYSCNVKCCRVMEIIEKLIDNAKKLQSAVYDSQENYVEATVIADNLIYIVAASLPWFSRDEFENNKKEIKKFCDQISKYNDVRNSKLAKINEDVEAAKKGKVAPNGKLTNPYAYMAVYRESINMLSYSDRLVTAVNGLKSLLKNEWQSTTTYRFYQSKGIKEHIFGAEIKDNIKEDTRNVTNEIIETMLAYDASKIKGCKPIVTMNLHFHSKYQEMEEISVHDKWLLEDHVLHTIYAFKNDTALCAKQLLLIPHNSYYKEHAIVEVLFNVMLNPMYNQQLALFCVLVMQEMSTSEPKIEELFEDFYSNLADNMEFLDAAVVQGLVTVGSYWFSVEFCKVRKPALHKNGEDGINDTNGDMEVEPDGTTEEQIKQQIKEKNARLFFAMFKKNNNYVVNFNNRLIDKISRLIYVDRLLNYSPEELKESIKVVIQEPLLSVQRVFQNKPLEHRVFLNLLHFNKVAPEENDLINSRIIGFIKRYVNREPLTEMPSNLFGDDKTADVVMEDAPRDDEGDGTLDNGVKRWMRHELILIFWETLLVLGSKTLTHLTRLVENHADSLNYFLSQDNYVTFEESTIFKVLKLTREVLKSDTKKMELIVEMLLKKEVVKPEEACKFVFSYFPNEDFFSNHSLTIIHLAVDFVKTHVDGIRANFLKDSQNRDSLLMELEKEEIKMHDLLRSIMEQINNRIAQGTTVEIELFFENMLKNIIVLDAGNSVMLAPLIADAKSRGYHERVLSALNLALLSQHIKPCG
ncbi:cap binding like protein [Babesia gibsoni]|uniref:Cap binding like protein n=1 Tax=Babesia gibsoni TaxID=33632 RepID=A0AAD8LM81_BABGI|nr:cap binding like protein [Babesia gibsoni]